MLRDENLHGGGPLPLGGAVVVVDKVGAAQVVHLLLPARRQGRQQLLGPLGPRVAGVLPALMQPGVERSHKALGGKLLHGFIIRWEKHISSLRESKALKGLWNFVKFGNEILILSI